MQSSNFVAEYLVFYGNLIMKGVLDGIIGATMKLSLRVTAFTVFDGI